MKKIVKYSIWLLAGLLILPPNIYAQQDSLKKKRRIKDIVSVEGNGRHTKVAFPGGGVEVDEGNDTITKITIGHKRYNIIDKPGYHTRIQVVHIPRTEFKGHWAGFDLGLTNISSSPFEGGLAKEDSWMDLNSGKSVAVGMNLLQYNMGLQKNRHNFGLVTGVGWTINNYRFDSQYILIKGDDGNVTYKVSDRNIEKNKLVTSFLTVPLLLEVQIPSDGNGNGHDFFISAGPYGSFRLGSHTKVVFNDGHGREKEKSRDDLNLNAFKYGVMVRMGYKWVKLYAKCDLSPLFEKDRGPELYPWTIGLTLVQF